MPLNIELQFKNPAEEKPPVGVELLVKIAPPSTIKWMISKFMYDSEMGEVFVTAESYMQITDALEYAVLPE